MRGTSWMEAERIMCGCNHTHVGTLPKTNLHWRGNCPHAGAERAAPPRILFATIAAESRAAPRSAPACEQNKSRECVHQTVFKFPRWVARSAEPCRCPQQIDHPPTPATH